MYDEEPRYTLVVDTLAGAGYQVTRAAGTEQALARVAEATPDLIVCAARMAGIDGFTLLTRLRA